MNLRGWALLGLCLGLGSARAMAAEPDPESLYELSLEGSSEKLRPGAEGKIVFSIHTREGAYISSEAPLRVELKGTNLTPAKRTLTHADSVGAKREGKPHPDPRFEVPFQLQKSGAVDVKASFFICTAKLCLRQQKSLRLDVEAL